MFIIIKYNTEFATGTKLDPTLGNDTNARLQKSRIMDNVDLSMRITACKVNCRALNMAMAGEG